LVALDTANIPLYGLVNNNLVQNNILQTYLPSGSSSTTGVDVEGCRDSIISANTITVRGGDGVLIQAEATDNTITNNTITMTNQSVDNFGIEITQGDAIQDKITDTVSANTITATYSSSRPAIEVWHSGATLVRNRITGFESGVNYDNNGSRTAFTCVMKGNVITTVNGVTVILDTGQTQVTTLQLTNNSFSASNAILTINGVSYTGGALPPNFALTGNQIF
jgi:parallel beta-helix repeat protein